MAENSKIQWTDHTWQPWRGCTKVSPGCAHCYAEAMSRRNPGVLGAWGPQGTRVVANEAQWRLPVKWNAEAARAGERRRVFCASLADVFEDWRGPLQDSRGVQWWVRDNGSWTTSDHYRDTVALNLDHVRRRLFEVIHATPCLDWLLLTKRPERITPTLDRLRALGLVSSDHFPWPNVWLGTSVEDQQRADERIPHLLRTPAAVRFLSCEPLLGPVDLRPKAPDTYAFLGKFYDTGTFDPAGMSPAGDRVLNCFPKIDWVIAGGESGHHARLCCVEWVRSLVKQCQAASVPVFVKQLGADVRWSPASGASGLWPDHVRFDYEHRGEDSVHRIRLRDPKGGDMAEWSSDLRVRQSPTVEVS